MSSALEILAVSRLEKLVNHALRLDPASLQSLAQLAGKTLVVRSTFPPLVLTLLFLPSGEITLSPEAAENPHVSLTGNPVSLALLLADASERVSFAGSGVTLAGDQEILRALAAIIRQLDIDWEHPLAEIIGDTPAHLAGRAVRQAVKWQKTAFTRSSTGFGEFIREESGLTLSNAEAEPWFLGVRHLAADTDRLAARINRLRLGMDAASR